MERIENDIRDAYKDISKYTSLFIKKIRRTHDNICHNLYKNKIDIICTSMIFNGLLVIFLSRRVDLGIIATSLTCMYGNMFVYAPLSTLTGTSLGLLLRNNDSIKTIMSSHDLIN